MSYLFIKLFYLAFFVSVVTSNPPNCKIKNTSPAGTLCGVKGTDNENFQCYQVVNDRHECAMLCSQQAVGGCKSFKYNAKSKRCWISDHRVAKYVDRSDQSKYTYYDIKCFDCPDPCRDQTIGGGNLLYNGDFSHQSVCPWNILPPFNYTEIPPTPNSSGRSIASSEYPGKYNQSYNACPGYTYLYVFDWKVHVRFGGFDFPLNFTASIEDLVGISRSKKIPLNNTFIYAYYASNKKAPWTRVYGFGKLPENGLQAFRFQTNQGRRHPRFRGQATYSIANVGIYRMPDVDDMEVKPDTNVIVNGDFEAGKNPSPWETHGRVVSPGIDSMYGIRLSRRLQNGQAMEQAITVKPHTPYLLTFKMRAVRVDKEDFFYVFMDTDAAARSNVVIPAGPGNYSFAIPLASSQAQTALGIHTSQGGRSEDRFSQFIFDDFRLEEISNLPFPFNN